MFLAGTLGGIIALAVVTIIWAIGVYNRLISNRSLKEEGWSGVDVQLKRRHDLIGDLINAVKGSMQHERTVLEELTLMRAEAQQAGGRGMAAVAAAEARLGQALGRLFAVMENYPALKASENVMQLREELRRLDNDIQMARRYFNATVRDFNILVQSFPSNIVARRFAFTVGEFFELNTAEARKAPKVAF